MNLMNVNVRPSDLRQHPGGVAYFRVFTATGQRGNLSITLDVELIAPGEPILRGLTIEVPDGQSPSEPVEDVPVRRLMLDAAARSASLAQPVAPGRLGPISPERRLAIREHHKASVRPRRNAAPPPWEVARVVAEAHESGDNPAGEVMDRFDAKKTHAYRLIDGARSAGFLPE